MIYGLTIGQCVILAGVLAGVVMVLVGTIGMLWPRRTHTGDVLEVELFHVRVRSNVLAVGVVVGGILLLGGGYWATSRSTPQFPLAGRVLLDDGTSVAGISIGVIPPKHFAVTSSNGTFKLDLPKPNSDESGSYQAVVYYRDQNLLRAEIASVFIDQNWVATLDHRFGRR